MPVLVPITIKETLNLNENDLKSPFVTQYLRQKELENAEEPDHTDVLQEKLKEAAKLSKETYTKANQVKKTKIMIRNKKAMFE